MPKLILNGKQFRQLIAGQVVFLGNCELMLGDLDFEIAEVTPVSKVIAFSRKALNLVKG
jgi:hypothetical protein